MLDLSVLPRQEIQQTVVLLDGDIACAVQNIAEIRVCRVLDEALVRLFPVAEVAAGQPAAAHADLTGLAVRNGLAVLVEQYNLHVAAGFADRNGFIVAVVAGEMECGTVHGGLGRSVHVDNLKTRNRGLPRVHIARLQRFTAESGFAQRGRRALAQCT